MKIFISHAAVNADLAKALVDFIQLGGGVHHADIFCSSITGHIPNGAQFVDHILRKLAEADLVITLLSPAFFQSDFCKAEVGAAQIKKISGATLFHVLLIPPVGHADLTAMLHDVQVGNILSPANLDELHGRVTQGNLHPPDITVWNTKRDEFLARVTPLVRRGEAEELKNLVRPMDVQFIRDNTPGRKYPLKLNVTFRNEAGTSIDVKAPDWKREPGELSRADTWSGIQTALPNRRWSDHTHQATLPNGESFRASVAFDPSCNEEDLRHWHENLKIGTLVLPMRINGYDVVLEKKI